MDSNYHKDYYEKNRSKWRGYFKTWYSKHKKEANLKTRKERHDLKVEVLTHYSTKPYPVCADPFHLHLPNDPMLTDIDCLTVDHINDGGTKERKTIGYGSSFYLWLKRNNFPSGFQDLCWNCQWKKRIFSLR